MAGNNSAIWSRVPSVSWGVVTTANTAKDGTGTQVTVFTADATNGGRVEKLVIRSRGTNVATVLRVFINNGATNATAGNNTLYKEMTIDATTLSEVAALSDFELPLDLGLDPTFKINVAIGTTVAAGLAVTAVGGKY